MALQPARARVRSRRRQQAVVLSRSNAHTPVGEIVRAQRDASQQDQDPFQKTYGMTGELSAIEPPYGFGFLRRLVRESSVLPQCIDAMVTNITSFGWRLEYIGPEGEEESTAAQTEKARMEALLNNPNPDYTLTELRARCRKDLETLGMGYVDFLRISSFSVSLNLTVAMVVLLVPLVY
jgi:capsid portal protein